MQARPLRNVSGLQKVTRRSPPTILKALDTLGELGIVREVTGRRRNRVFEYRRYMELLNREV
jgi:Fic family protein